MATAVLVSGTVIEDVCSSPTQRYCVGELLGKGGFALCYEFTSLTSSIKFAGKVVAKSSLSNSVAKSKLRSEIKLHRSLSHPNVVKFYSFFEDRDNVYIILELCKHQTLMEMVKRRGRLSCPEVQFFMKQIISAVDYLHRNNVIHRDLKLGNIFLHDQLTIKVGDLGLAALLETEEEQRRTLCGTPNYVAPEIIDNKAGGHSFEVDIWSLGVIMYTLLVGQPPFETSHVKETYSRIRNNVYEYPITGAAVSATAKDLISRMLVVLPERRASLDELRRHAFFSTSQASTSLPLSALTRTPNVTERPIKKSSSPRFKHPAPPADKRKRTQKAMEKKHEEEIQHNLVGLCQDIEMSLSFGRLSLQEGETPTRLSWPRPSPFVVQTCDGSKRYGFGYRTSVGCIGVYFNDGKNIIADPSLSFFHYYERHSLVKQVGSIKAHPKRLHNRVLLLRSFINKLLPDKNTPDTSMPLQGAELVFVLKWSKAKGVWLFSLSNWSSQVIFPDGSEILISQQKVVAYTDKVGTTTTYHLEHMQGNEPRDYQYYLKYAKDVIGTVSKETDNS